MYTSITQVTATRIPPREKTAFFTVRSLFWNLIRDIKAIRIADIKRLPDVTPFKEKEYLSATSAAVPMLLRSEYCISIPRAVDTMLLATPMI